MSFLTEIFLNIFEDYLNVQCRATFAISFVILNSNRDETRKHIMNEARNIVDKNKMHILFIK